MVIKRKLKILLWPLGNCDKHFVFIIICVHVQHFVVITNKLGDIQVAEDLKVTGSCSPDLSALPLLIYFSRVKTLV